MRPDSDVRKISDLVGKTSNPVITIKPFKMQTREVQGKLWSSAPLDWAKYLEPRFIPLYRAVLSRLNLGEALAGELDRRMITV